MLKIKAEVGMLVRETATKINNPAAILPVCADLAESAQEMMIVIDLNTKHKMITRRLVSLGLLDQTVLHAREIFRGAIHNAAAKIVLVHNHPSGDHSPSQADITVTGRLVSAGQLLGIPVLDSCIIGHDDDGQATMFSMRESGLMSFQDE